MNKTKKSSQPVLKIKKIHISKEQLFLLLIIGIGLFLRLFRISHAVGFDFDQEYAVTFAQTVLKVYPIQLIGQGLSVQGLFMGPLYFYYLVPFFAMTSLHPLGGYIGSVLVGVITIAAYYYVIRQVFGRTAGLLAAFLRAILIIKLQADWSMAPSYSSEIAIVLTYYCFYKYWKEDYKYLPLLGFVFGLYTSFHPIHFPFYFIFLIIILLKRKLPPIKYIVLFVLFFIIPLTPLLLFEYFHKFLELKLLFSMKGNTGEVKTLKTFFEYSSILFHYPLLLFGFHLQGILREIVSGVIVIGMIITSRYVSFWKDKFHYAICISCIAIFLAYYYFLPIHASEYYFLGPEIIIFIYITAILAYALTYKKWKIFVYFLIGVTVLGNIHLYVKWQQGVHTSLADKEAIVKEISKQQQIFKKDLHYMYIFQDIDFGQHYGFGYLMRYYDVTDDGGEGAPKYYIVLPKTKTHKKLNYSVGNIGLIITK